MSADTVADERPTSAAQPRLVLLRLALRELRGGLSGFYVFVACIALGVAVIAGVGALADAVQTFTNATPADWSELAKANAAIAQATGGQP